jgi:hypothetical protein
MLDSPALGNKHVDLKSICREVRAPVACPVCRGSFGEHCIGDDRAHAEHRAAWQTTRGPVPEITPTIVCACEHKRNRTRLRALPASSAAKSATAA